MAPEIKAAFDKVKRANIRDDAGWARMQAQLDAVAAMDERSKLELSKVRKCQSCTHGWAALGIDHCQRCAKPMELNLVAAYKRKLKPARRPGSDDGRTRLTSQGRNPGR